MATRYKVRFFDVEHLIYRSVEVQAASPMAAAEAGLRWMLRCDRYVTDFADDVRVEIVTTTEHHIPFKVVAERFENASVPEAKVA
jgi:hypothetical protein